MRRFLTLFAFLLALAASAPEARAQTVPENVEAESTFEQGLEAFTAGDYGMAYRRFRLVYQAFPFNQKTTAAVLMAARARYRLGETEPAAELLRQFVREYPTSSYAADARVLLARIEGADADRRPTTVDVGIALPFDGANAALTQALFNGFRLAVNEHDASAPAVRVRMVFRDTRNDAAGAQAAVADLSEAAVIVGPLFSDEAIAAAEAAERASVTLVTPLATDDRVAEGRRFVFQANPTLSVRGRAMARYAVEEMNLTRFGVAYETDEANVSERLARGFADEIRRRDGEVAFLAPVPNARGWAALADAAGGELGSVDGLYLPVSGGNAETDIRAALGALARAAVTPTALGDAEWHNRAAARGTAPAFNTTYTNDFFVDDARPDVRAFRERYRALAGRDLASANFTTQRLAFTGYDLGRYLVARLEEAGDRRLPDVMRRAAPFDGLGVRLDFSDGNVNRALSIHRYVAGGATERVR